MSVFWGTGIRRKIAGTVKGQMLEAEIHGNGINFYAQGGGSKVLLRRSWYQILESGATVAQVPPKKGPGIRIVEAEEK